MNDLSELMDKAATGGAAGAPNSAAEGERRVLRVWMVDDNDQLREGFAELLGSRPWLRVSRQFDSTAALLAALKEERPPQLILLDLNLDGETSLPAIPAIKQLAPTVKVVLFTTFNNTLAEAEAARLGATGFILKIYEIEEILALIRLAFYHPADSRLFPNLALHNQLAAAEASRPTVTTTGPKRSRFLSALRQLYRPHRPEPAR